jgi:hypothetical protein
MGMAPINQDKMIVSMCDSHVFARATSLSLSLSLSLSQTHTHTHTCNLINDGEDRFAADCHGAARSSQKLSALVYLPHKFTSDYF